MSTIKGYVGDMMSFLFGNVLAVTPSDLLIVSALSVLVLLALMATYKELLFATFDPLGAPAPATLGSIVVTALAGTVAAVTRGDS